ncbi:MAG: carboxypeptidase-like regulatory domain-containing protein [Bdellovibrionales bacterium]
MSITRLIFPSLVSIASILSVAITGCKNIPKNRVAGDPPLPMECNTENDPSCMGMATVGAQIPIPGSTNPTTGETETLSSIFGRCELFVEGDLSPRPCAGVRLVVTGTREGESRTATIDKFNFHFTDLERDTYRLQAEGEGYEILTDKKELLMPGQQVNIRLKAKPKD